MELIVSGITALKIFVTVQIFMDITVPRDSKEEW